MRRLACTACLPLVLYLGTPHLLRLLLSRIYQPPDLNLLWPMPSSPSPSTSNEQETRTASDPSSSTAYARAATPAHT